jgi:signal transduction histidine kinase
METGAPVVGRVDEGDQFAGHEVAAAAELRQGIGVPIPAHESTLGAILLLRKAGVGADQRSVAIVADIGLQLGLFLERREAEAKLQEIVLGDDTVRHQAERALRSAHKLEAIARLAGGIAHDFNNYLTVISSYTHLLATGLDADDERRADIEEIRSAVARASRLTRQLLAFGRRQVLMPRAVDVNEVVTGLETLLRRLVGEHAHFSVSEASAPAVVLADAGQLEQVVVNLIVNARDATPNGGAITLGAEVLDEASKPIMTPEGARSLSGRWVRFFVRDTGSGIPDDVIDKIFDPFFTTKEVGKGTGLGLATVYGIVSQSGGYLTIETAVGEGTCFSVYFPEESSRDDASASAVPSRPQTLRGDETVLLVEDDDPVRRVTSRALRGRGYTVLEAAGAGEALLFLERHTGPIDLLLTDVVMPLMSGIELAEQVAARWPGLRQLFMTGYAGHGEVALPAGAVVLAKPFELQELTQAVRDALDRPTV